MKWEEGAAAFQSEPCHSSHQRGRPAQLALLSSTPPAPLSADLQLSLRQIGPWVRSTVSEYTHLMTILRLTQVDVGMQAGLFLVREHGCKMANCHLNPKAFQPVKWLANTSL